MAVDHRVALVLHDFEACGRDLGGKRLRIEPGDEVPRLLVVLGEADARREHRGPGPRGLVDRDRQSARPEHLPDPRLRRSEVVEPVVDIEEVDGAVAQRERLGVGDHGQDIESVSPRAFPGALRGAQRDVRRDD